MSYDCACHRGGDRLISRKSLSVFYWWPSVLTPIVFRSCRNISLETRVSFFIPAIKVVPCVILYNIISGY